MYHLHAFLPAEALSFAPLRHAGKAFPGFIDILVNDLDVALARAQTYNTKTYEDFTDRVQAFKQESQGASHGGDLIERVSAV